MLNTKSFLIFATQNNMGQLLHFPAVSNMCKHDQQIIFEQPLLPCVNFVKVISLHCLYYRRKPRAKLQICALICVICKDGSNKQISITFEPYVNAPQIYSLTSPLRKGANPEQMWHLPSLLRVVNLVQY